MSEVEAVRDARVGRPAAARPTGAPAAIHTPAIDVIEGPEAVVVLADLPGVRETDVEITLNERVLTLVARRAAADHGGMRRVFAETEQRPVEYRRAFTLSDRVDPERIEATLRNGTLRVAIPVREETKPRRVAIQVAG